MIKLRILEAPDEFGYWSDDEIAQHKAERDKFYSENNDKVKLAKVLLSVDKDEFNKKIKEVLGSTLFDTLPNENYFRNLGFSFNCYVFDISPDLRTESFFCYVYSTVKKVKSCIKQSEFNNTKFKYNNKEYIIKINDDGYFTDYETGVAWYNYITSFKNPIDLCQALIKNNIFDKDTLIDTILVIDTGYAYLYASYWGININNYIIMHNCFCNTKGDGYYYTYSSDTYDDSGDAYEDAYDWIINKFELQPIIDKLQSKSESNLVKSKSVDINSFINHDYRKGSSNVNIPSAIEVYDGNLAFEFEDLFNKNTARQFVDDFINKNNLKPRKVDVLDFTEDDEDDSYDDKIIGVAVVCRFD